MEIDKINEIIVGTLNQWVNSSLFLSNLVIFCAIYLGWLILAYLPFYFYSSRSKFKSLKTIFISLLTGVVALFVVYLIKSLYPISRPFIDLPKLIKNFEPLGNSAFPSSHSAFFGGLGFSFWLRDKRRGKYLLWGAIIIAVARVAGGVHWPTDVLVGLLVGLGLASLFNRFYQEY